jgi:hypothetical protein
MRGNSAESKIAVISGQTSNTPHQYEAQNDESKTHGSLLYCAQKVSLWNSLKIKRDDVIYGEGKGIQAQDRGSVDEDEERPVIPSANAVIEPNTVMIFIFYEG